MRDLETNFRQETHPGLRLDCTDFTRIFTVLEKLNTRVKVLLTPVSTCDEFILVDPVGTLYTLGNTCHIEQF